MPRVTLQTLDQKLDFLLEKLTEHSAKDVENFTNIQHSLDGNGGPGMKVRLDRIEQLESGRKWHIRTIWGAMMAGMVAWFVDNLNR